MSKKEAISCVCSCSTFFSFTILERSFLLKLFKELKKIFDKWFVPFRFRSKPELPEFALLLFLLSKASTSSWRRWLKSWFNVSTGFPTFARKFGGEIITLQSECFLTARLFLLNLFCISPFSGYIPSTSMDFLF